ncbi:hypothetical protein N2152v2_008243 [Parachlorella kessleri]
MSRQKGLQAVMLGAGRLGEMAASGMGLKVKRRSGPKSKSSPYLGVTQYKKTLRWEAEEAAKCYDRAAIRTRGPQAELNFPYQSYHDDDFLKQHLRLGKEPFLKLMRDTFALKSAAALPPPRRPAGRTSPTAGTSAAAAARQGRLTGGSSDTESPSDASTQPSPRHQPLRDSGSSGARSGDQVRLPLRRAAMGHISHRELAREEEEWEGSERDASEEPAAGRLTSQGMYRAGSGGGRAPSVHAAAAGRMRQPASAGATVQRAPLAGLPGHKSAGHDSEFEGVGEEDLLGDEHDLLLVQNPMAHSLGEEALWGAGVSPLCLSPLQHRPSPAPLQALQWQQPQQQHHSDIHPKQEQQPHLLPVQQAPTAFQQLQLAPERPMHFLPRSATNTPLLEGPLALEGDADLLAPQPKPLNLHHYHLVGAGQTLWAPLAVNMPGAAGSTSTHHQPSMGLANFGTGWNL